MTVHLPSERTTQIITMILLNIVMILSICCMGKIQLHTIIYTCVYTIQYILILSKILKIWKCIFFTASEAADSVKQPPTMLASQGDTAQLNCEFVTSDPSPYLFWYIQRTGEGPKFLLLSQKFVVNNTEFPDRFHATLSTDRVPLTISSVQLSDSAMYYCALRPTVTGTHGSLIQKLKSFMATKAQQWNSSLWNTAL